MTKRLNVDVSDSLHEYLCDLASRQQTTVSEIVRKGLAVMKAADRYMASTSEPVHLGFVDDPKRLDVLLIGVLD